jgi:hypothetical protein
MGLTYVLHPIMILTLANKSSVLDPRISYSGLLADCGDDLEARAHLESSKEKFHAHFRAKYEKPLRSTTAPVTSNSMTNGSPQKVDFTSRYRNLPQAFTDEVQEYFKLPRENFDTCDPLQWWAGRRSQFRDLSRFARDMLAIPGELTTLLMLFNRLVIPSRIRCGRRTYLFRKP